MDTILINSGNRTLIILDYYSILQINLKSDINMLLYQILACTIYGKILKSSTKTINLKHHLQCGMIYLNYLMNQTLCQIFSIILSISSKT